MSSNAIGARMKLPRTLDVDVDVKVKGQISRLNYDALSVWIYVEGEAKAEEFMILLLFSRCYLLCVM